MKEEIYIRQKNKANREHILKIINKMIKEEKNKDTLKELKNKIRMKDNNLNYFNKKFLEDNYKLNEEIKTLKIEIKTLKYIRRQNQSLFNKNMELKEEIRALYHKKQLCSFQNFNDYIPEMICDKKFRLKLRLLISDYKRYKKE